LRLLAHHDVALEVLEGAVVLWAGDDEFILTPHDEATIPAGLPHRYWNGSDEAARVVETTRRRWRSGGTLVTVLHRPPYRG
jgi:mannose-6-phosphate isomerase-like protein (cupin superfamily)